MSLKAFLFLAPVAVGGYFVANRGTAPASAAETAAVAKAPAHKSEAECRALEERLMRETAATPMNGEFAAMQRINAMYRALRSQGCEPGSAPGSPTFETPRAAMGPAPAGSGAPRADGTSFEPGRPMVDVRRGGSR